MTKNKFFAFFNTEADFLKFMFKYIEDHSAVLRAHDEDIRHITRIWMMDHVTVALGRMGFRETKFGTLNKVLDEVIQEYMKEYSDDLKCDKEMTYSRDLLDRELKQYTGKLFAPENERYAY